MQPVFLGGKRRSSMFTLKKLSLILKWASVGQRNAEDPVQWMLWALWSACASKLQPWSWKYSQGYFPSFSMQQKSLYKDVICHFLFFASVLQPLVTFSHPALDLGSWVTVSCFFPSNNKSFPCLVINNKLGASVLKSWETRLVDVWIFWVFQ